MIKKYCGLFVAIAISFSGSYSYANSDATKAVREFMISLYSNDKTGYEKAILPCFGSEELLGKKSLNPDQLAQVRKDVASMELALTDPFQLYGQDVKPDKMADYPVGTRGERRESGTDEAAG